MEGRDLRANYEDDLNRLKTAQRNAAVADLENTRNQALSNLDAERRNNASMYNQQRSTANVQNRLGAKNFQEYLAQTGRANSGLSAQARMQNQNNLNTNINYLNAGEAGALADINRRTTDANNAYNSGLAAANANIEANYIQNLLNERQKEWERQMAEKQFNESVRQFNENKALQTMYSGGSGRSSSSSGGSSKTYAVNTPWYQGPLNSDVKNGTFSTKDNNGIAYQPDNINGKKLSSSGKTVGQMFGNGNLVGSTGANLDNQKVWKLGSKYYVWDGSQNQYIQVR